jgi:uncharacterized membrane protein
MHGFFPGPFFFAPALLFFGLLRIAFWVLLIVLLVRLFTHGHAHWAHYGHDHAHRHPHGNGPDDLDPRKVAALRYASGEIDRSEFERIIGGLDAAAPRVPTPPPGAPTAQA